MSYSLKIVSDDCSDNPRDWDNLCTIVAFHRRYDFGDNVSISKSNFNSWKEVEEHIRKMDVVFCAPLYMYEHSGVAISTSPFNCRWDSGQVGFIFATKEKVRRSFGVKRINTYVKNRSIEIADSEVKILSNYLNGDVWGYVIEDEKGNEIDSCYGFYEHESAEQEGQVVLNKLINK